MRELIRTNDPVVLSLVTSLLTEENIGTAVFDQNMSIMEGSIGVLPKRLMVAPDDYAKAHRILTEAGLDEWIKEE